ncbi:MAG: protein phosphatase CheZ [Pseudomonadota bacterium]
MTSLAIDQEIEERLADMDLEAGGLDARELIALLSDIKGRLGQNEGGAGSAPPQRTDMRELCHELTDLAGYIANARAEISEIRPDEITDEHLPMVADELDAIVGATEQATNRIFEAVEGIEALADQMPPEVAEQVVAGATSVYEACGFQDITGQRISKVVSALKQVEEKVIALRQTFGQAEASDMPSAAKVRKTTPSGAPARPDEHLLNGPQMAEDAISQDDIDALLAVD